MKIINPATEELIKDVQEDSQTSIQQKFEATKKAQKAWAQVPLKERIACIAKFNELMLANSDKIAADLTAEVGKPLDQAKGEINGGVGRSQYFVDNSEKYLAEEWAVTEGGTKEKIVYEPLGVIANISAWNYPILVGVNVFIPALIGGNAVLYKPSEFSTLTGLNIADKLWEAGIPKDVFQIVVGGKDAGEALLDLPLDGYFFTGSYRTGKYIAERAAGKLVPVGLELGGKDPMYVCDDVDVKAVAASGVEGAFYNNGQSCCAVERIYVHEKVYDAFVDAFIEEAKTMKMGLPTEDGAFIGPLTRPQQADVLADQVADATAKGATLLLGGKAAERPGYYFEPTVLTDVTHEMKVMMDESFGPIIGIQKVKDDAEAVELMIDTPYGLASSVFTNDQSRAERIMAEMNSGTVYWNCCDRVSPTSPWSGRGHSGLGSTLSHHGIRAFVQPKAYHLRG
ncbi:MAG: aldehyde dehydrogenase family protein [Flavobacteriales bacterium]|nr:aldehyde dehydrogenase family protein [Flavobacteriales bacterium]MCB9190677.1 aldehyde dehydrogenase family protein [Flavobacteriales bacterium]